MTHHLLRTELSLLPGINSKTGFALSFVFNFYTNTGASAYLRDYSSKSDNTIRIVVGNTALVAGDNGLRGGQPDTICRASIYCHPLKNRRFRIAALPASETFVCVGLFLFRGYAYAFSVSMLHLQPFPD